ncbi:hypothetical protein ACFL5Q_00215 [Planctomycetota bacterium]
MKRSGTLRLLWIPLAWAAAASCGTFAAEPPQSPPPRNRAAVEAVLAKAPPASAESELRPLHIVLLADEKDHGLNEHDYPLWQKHWELLLGGKQDGDSHSQVNLYGPPAPGDPKLLLAGTPKVKVTAAWKWLVNLTGLLTSCGWKRTLPDRRNGRDCPLKRSVHHDDPT